MNRLLLVSNRLPVAVERKKGSITYQNSVGGLATGLDSFYRSYNCLWFGWPGTAQDKFTNKELSEIFCNLQQRSCVPVHLTKADLDNYYEGFSNRTIWPLFHYFSQFAVYEKHLWTSYVKVNAKFRDIILDYVKPGDHIWIHDYQLMLLPQMLRERIPDANIGFFLHIPFPSLELFRLLPWRENILHGLLGADLIGFHTYEYIRHFLNSVRRLIGFESTFNQITYYNRFVRTEVFPMGIDYHKYAQIGNLPEVIAEETKIKRHASQRKLIISIDRLDYTKGIIQRLEAYDVFLEKNPQFKEKVTLILVEVPSRSTVDSYKSLKKQIDELTGKINGKFGTISWTPIINFYRSLPLHTLGALYHLADVALITPLRDGMNLVAKEFIAVKQNRPGVLILSEMTGAAREMGEAIIVNPNNIEQISEAIKDALLMDEAEQMERIKKLQKRLQRYDINSWANDFMSRLKQNALIREELKLHHLSKEKVQKIQNSYSKSEKRLFLFVYDGTLVPLVDTPDHAIPDLELLDIIKRLNSDPCNKIAILSSHNKMFLEKWFGNLSIQLFAEHGTWYKDGHQAWRALTKDSNKWKDELRPILELYTDRTPGSNTEENENSLIWHYRAADPDLSSIRVRELTDALIHLVANLNLRVIEGNKVIEIRNASINKGTAASILLSESDYPFVLACGTDNDEELFAVLPPNAFSIKIGLCPSLAHYHSNSTEEIRQFLRDLLDCESAEKLQPSLV